MSKIKILPSIMCCKVEEFKPFLEKFEQVGIDAIHFDVMDGHYVKNIMLGTPVYKDIKRLSHIPVDVHIMAIEPENFVEYYDIQPGDSISFHPETTNQPYKLLQTIKNKGCKAGLVLNPGTPLVWLDECIELLDFVTLMTVNPGFAGQKMTPNSLEKIKRIRSLLDKHGKDIDLIVDGNTTFENSLKMKKAGANAFVTGTSSMLASLDEFETQYEKYVENLRKAD